jgi:hypothetical protein
MSGKGFPEPSTSGGVTVILLALSSRPNFCISPICSLKDLPQCPPLNSTQLSSFFRTEH